MAKEFDVMQVLKDAGYTPYEDRSIIVTYVAPNLSAIIAKFFVNEFYILTLCKNEVTLIPFGSFADGYPLKKEIALAIPNSTIQSVSITEKGLNYDILIKADESEITLSTQQKELSDFRTAGSLAFGFGKDKSGSNWHKENLDQTLEALLLLG